MQKLVHVNNNHRGTGYPSANRYLVNVQFVKQGYDGCKKNPERSHFLSRFQQWILLESLR